MSVTVRLEQHVENFSEESGVLQVMKVCSMSANERKGEDKRLEPREGVARVKEKSLAEDTENKNLSFFRDRELLWLTTHQKPQPP